MTVIARPRTDHHFTDFSSQTDAFAERGGRADPSVIDELLRWVRTLQGER